MLKNKDSGMEGGDEWDAAAFARLRRLGGEALLRKMIALFLDAAPGRVARARSGQRDGDLSAIGREVHSLKSSAGNVGAARLAAVAEQIEERAAAGDAAAMVQLLPELEEAFARVRARLSAPGGQTP